MSLIIENPATEQHILATHPNGAVHVIVVRPGHYFGTGMPNVLQTENAADILEAGAGALDVSVVPELPPEGEICFASKYYRYGDRLVFCRQEHERTGFTPEQTPALFYFYRDNPEGMEWIEQEKVVVGNTRTYNGETYIVLQDHVTQAQWQPDITPALWQKQAVGNVWAVGIAVTVGEEYWYPDTNGTLYRCLQSHTTQAGWTPPVVPALWAVV